MAEQVAERAATSEHAPGSRGEETAEVTIRGWRPEDGAAVWRLVRDSGVLDLNSAYCYLLLGEHFGATSVVAEVEGEVVGFVAAYRPPPRPEVIFVWQVGVSEDWRGHGIAGRLLRGVLRRDACAGVTHLETSVTPSNRPSQALFRSLARRLGAELEVSVLFGEELFPAADGEVGGHEAEELYRIGPIAPTVR